jgi:hypothetical protein
VTIELLGLFLLGYGGLGLILSLASVIAGGNEHAVYRIPDELVITIAAIVILFVELGG